MTVDTHLATATQQRAWALTGEHGWTEAPKFYSKPGWHVFPGMVMPVRYSNRVAALGLGDVRVVGTPRPATSYNRSAWAIPVESVETGERGIFTTYSYDSHDCYVVCPAYMASDAAFHAQYNGVLSYADERFPA